MEALIMNGVSKEEDFEEAFGTEGVGFGDMDVKRWHCTNGLNVASRF